MTADAGKVLELMILAGKRGIGTGVDWFALESVVAAEVEAVERIAGPAAVTDVILSEIPTDIISTLRRVGEITEVSERRLLTDALAVTLVDGTDFRLLDDFKILRLGSATYWGQQVIVAYQQWVDPNLRDRVVLDLVKLSLSFRTYERSAVGELAITDDYAERRAALLEQVTDGRVLAL